MEVCAVVKSQTTPPIGNFAFIILGRDFRGSSGLYYGLLFRNPNPQVFALMAERSFFTETYHEFSDVPASFSFPNFNINNENGFFNGIIRAPNGSNTLNYNATTRGTVARIGGTAQQPLPIEVYNIRLYSRALTSAEIARNYQIDKARFGLP